PLAAILFDQLARVAAGRKAMVVAVLRNEHQQIAIGGGPVSGDRHGDIANHMTKLRARGALRREAAGGGADFVAAADVDDRALEDRVYREAIDHGLDLAVVERAAIAREEIVDRRTIFEVAFAHSLSPWSGLSGPTRWPSVRDVMLSHSRVVYWTHDEAAGSRAAGIFRSLLDPEPSRYLVGSSYAPMPAAWCRTLTRRAQWSLRSSGFSRKA